MNARTKTLFHFTKKYEVMKLILDEGFWPQYSLEDVSWIECNIQRLAWPMVSFCDIPLLRLREHTDFYGDYGIGLCRQRWKAYGLNPLLYVSSESMLRRELGELLLKTTKDSDWRTRTCANVLLAHCKQMEGIMEANGEARLKNFYAENEWRYLPWVEGVGGENQFGFILSEHEFSNSSLKASANRERRKQMLTIEPDDIRYLIVKTKEEVRDLIQFISEMEHRSAITRDMLKTRIMLLDDIRDDL